MALAEVSPKFSIFYFKGATYKNIIKIGTLDID